MIFWKWAASGKACPITMVCHTTPAPLVAHFPHFRRLLAYHMFAPSWPDPYPSWHLLPFLKVSLRGHQYAGRSVTRTYFTRSLSGGLGEVTNLLAKQWAWAIEQNGRQTSSSLATWHGALKYPGAIFLLKVGGEFLFAWRGRLY
jgi:hypothetical protein